MIFGAVSSIPIARAPASAQDLPARPPARPPACPPARSSSLRVHSLADATHPGQPDMRLIRPRAADWVEGAGGRCG